jgi:branched-chain amino acid transport system ATP-binding protein
MGQTMLEVKNLDVAYHDFEAVHGISLSIEEGSVVSIIGANGAGKSTIMKTIVGINKPRKGSIHFMGNDIAGSRTSKIVSMGLTMSPEGSHAFEKMTVKDNLLMGAFLAKNNSERLTQLEKIFQLFPVLKEKENQVASFLSGGQRQMLAIGRAIMAQPKLLLLDEVSLGLAPVIIKDIYAKLKEIKDQGITMLIVEQDVTRSLKHSDYAYVVLEGRIVMQGKSSELDINEVNDAYFGMNKYA